MPWHEILHFAICPVIGYPIHEVIHAIRERAARKGAEHGPA